MTDRRDQVSGGAGGKALAFTGVLRERLARAKHAAVGQALGKSDSWAGKVIDEQMGVPLDLIEPLAAALGLKLVDLGDVTVDPAVFESYRQLATIALTEPALLRLRSEP